MVFGIVVIVFFGIMVFFGIIVIFGISVVMFFIGIMVFFGVVRIITALIGVSANIHVTMTRMEKF
jgi:hypothetical protein